MPSVKSQVQEFASQLPAALRQPAMQVLAGGPDIPLPNIVPTVRFGNSATISIPTPGGQAVNLTVPSPMDAVSAIEGVFPQGVPKLSNILGLPRSGKGAMSKSSDPELPQTSFRGVSDGKNEGGASTTSGGGYRRMT